MTNTVGIKFGLSTRTQGRKKTLLQQGLSEPEFYDDLVYNLKKISRADYSDQFRKVIKRYKRIASDSVMGPT